MNRDCNSKLGNLILVEQMFPNLVDFLPYHSHVVHRLPASWTFEIMCHIAIETVTVHKVSTFHCLDWFRSIKHALKTNRAIRFQRMVYTFMVLYVVPNTGVTFHAMCVVLPKAFPDSAYITEGTVIYRSMFSVVKEVANTTKKRSHFNLTPKAVFTNWLKRRAVHAPHFFNLITIRLMAHNSTLGISHKRLLGNSFVMTNSTAM
mmetsp:Transcript_9678/g.15894  ORF Transcript_9678/g.15894 Transcript_9678/m.15894 type:complete len:204 (+) Transcript_9678:2162-2773(+)